MRRQYRSPAVRPACRPEALHRRTHNKPSASAALQVAGDALIRLLLLLLMLLLKLLHNASSSRSLSPRDRRPGASLCRRRRVAANEAPLKPLQHCTK